MKEKPIVITNNPLTKSSLEVKFEVIYLEGASLMEVLIEVRDYIHRGHKLLTHPLMGSIKPNQTPYKSVAVSKKNYDLVDLMSLQIIEESILKADSLLKHKPLPNWPKQALEDFGLIDFDLIKNAIL
ncbi:GrdX family protein [Thermobrachium celere]|uniref:GrdX family protein n=1 Tax=Thermobrachium celere TaxID=53422 RepID=UPI000594218F|nr:GrdX family protein [Thermobrachium celere]